MHLTSVPSSDSVTFTVSGGFTTPFSAVSFNTVQVSTHADSQCGGIGTNLYNIDFSGMRFVSTEMTTPMTLSTSSTTIGDTSSASRLTATFTPQSSLSPAATGEIHLIVPYWYYVDISNFAYPYNTQDTECTSSCFDTISTVFVNNEIQIKYNNQVSSCNGATAITFTCTYWKNPIYQDVITGFYVSTYDTEGNVINTLQNDAELDA